MSLQIYIAIAYVGIITSICYMIMIDNRVDKLEKEINQIKIKLKDYDWSFEAKED